MTDAELIVARLRALVRERPASEVPLIPLDELAHILGQESAGMATGDAHRPRKQKQ